MRIRVIIPPNSLLKEKIKDKYTYLYNEYLRTNPTSKSYTRGQLNTNIRNAASVGKIYVDDVQITQPRFDRWAKNGWFVIPCYNHWYFAVILTKTKKGIIRAEIQDACYEGDYHNDIMQTQPYNESIIRIKESQLKNIIKESIRKVLNII